MTLCEAITHALPDVAAGDRYAALAGPLDRATHARIQRELAVLHRIEVAPPPQPAAELGEARVVAWNAARAARQTPRRRCCGTRRRGAAALGARRRHGALRTAPRWPASSRRASAWATRSRVEFVELGLGTAAERRAARVSRTARLPRSRRRERACPSSGPRSCASTPAATGSTGGAASGASAGGSRCWRRSASAAPVTLASVHLESHGDPAQRDAQIAALLAAVDSLRSGRAGARRRRLQHALARLCAELEDRAALADAVRADPERFAHPVAARAALRAAGARRLRARTLQRGRPDALRRRRAERAASASTGSSRAASRCARPRSFRRRSTRPARRSRITPRSR